MKNKWSRNIWLVVTALVVLGFMLGCSSMEQKRDGFFKEGKELFEKGDYTRAQLQFKNALQIDSKFAPAMVWLAKCQLKTENFRGAFGALNQAIEIDPKLAEAQILLGRLYLGGKEYEKAQACLKAALELEPQNTDALMLEAALAACTGKTRRSLSQYKKSQEYRSEKS